MSKVKVNFLPELDFVDDPEVFREQIVGAFRRGGTANNAMEAAALQDILGDIARQESEEEPVELSKSDIDVLEKHMNILIENEDNNVPNWMAGTFGQLIRDAKIELGDDG